MMPVILRCIQFLFILLSLPFIGLMTANSTAYIIHVPVHGNAQFHHEPRQATNNTAKGALRAAVVSFSFVPAHLPGSDGNCGPVLLGEPSVARVEKLMHIAFVDVDLPVQQAL